MGRALVRGVVLGQLDSELRYSPPVVKEVIVPLRDRQQVDLIADKNGFRITRERLCRAGSVELELRPK